MPARIHFYSLDVTLTLRSRRKLKQWIEEIANGEGAAVDEINFIFCSDSHLLQMNQQWLQHDTLTDVITFDLAGMATGRQGIAGEVYISLDRVKENARELNLSTLEECCRVMAHGVLHLLGYSDKSRAEKKRMREKEDLYLSLLRDSGLL